MEVEIQGDGVRESKLVFTFKILEVFIIARKPVFYVDALNSPQNVVPNVIPTF